MSKNNREEDAHGQRRNLDVKLEDSTTVFMSQKLTATVTNRTSVNAGEHSVTETQRYKRKRRLRSRNVDSSDKNDGDASADTNASIFVAAKKAKKRNKAVQPLTSTLQPSDCARNTKTQKTEIKKKLYHAAMGDCHRKKKKQNFDSNKIQAAVLHQKTAAESIGEIIASGADSLATSKNLPCDVQGFQDSIVDDYVSMNICNM